MNTRKLAGFIFASLLITGCQQSHLTMNTPITDQTIHADDAIASNAPQDCTGDEKQAPDTEESRVDQALELCNLAQNYWEQGNLEEALSNLDAAYALMLEINATDNSEVDQQKEDIRYLISKRILEIYASRQIVVTGQHTAIPITLNEHVNAEIKLLTGSERGFFIRALNRSTRYRPYIVQELKKSGLPEEISWLPLIESGFQIKALSPARALGLWQFIPSTGNKFGLNRTYYIDERMDPEKSTRAAIDYLKELHNLFGDWTTALAAYNCGEYRVLKTIRNQKINYLDNFWDLYHNLPQETARYVPRFLATLHIVNNLDKYNITATEPLEPIEYKAIDVEKQARLSDIASAISIGTEVLTTLNPELRHQVLPPEPYKIKIPIDSADRFVTKIEDIKTIETNIGDIKPAYKESGPQYTYYRIRKGDTLFSIATKFKTSVGTITRCNKNLKKSRIVIGSVLRIPGSNHHVNSRTASMNRKTSVSKSSNKFTYTVRTGDNLWLIAQNFSTTTKQIQSLNNLSGTAVNVGQRLTIVKGADMERTVSAKKTAKYKVKYGDSPLCIAKKYNMSVDRLLSLNHLSKRSKIYPGQNLLVE